MADDEQTTRVAWDWDALTTQEAMDLEDAAGVVVPAIIATVKAGLPTVRMLAALTWIARRRDDPDLTFDDVLAENVTYNALAEQAHETVRPDVSD